MGSYYAQLTRNGRSDADGPEVWITPPTWPVMVNSLLLAHVIARVTETDFAIVKAAMNDSVNDNSHIHHIFDGVY
ncbi:hypothetical protein [Actinoplanes sp. NPDC051851]|uniref:hypothetical protein n=1 Tax=Actinoplanes sp. NPDC051851 TaxID=3154753 RepID=UPI00343E9E62